MGYVALALLIALYAVSVARDPQQLRKIAAYLMARAEALDAFRNSHTFAQAHWTTRLLKEKSRETAKL